MLPEQIEQQNCPISRWLSNGHSNKLGGRFSLIAASRSNAARFPRWPSNGRSSKLSGRLTALSRKKSRELFTPGTQNHIARYHPTSGLCPALMDLTIHFPVTWDLRQPLLDNQKQIVVQSCSSGVISHSPSSR